jgi:hypothetical protein
VNCPLAHKLPDCPTVPAFRGQPGKSAATLRRVFERFTDRARRVLVLAQEEARLLNHSFIGTEHILLGLIGERDGVAAQVLRTHGISLEAAREMVEAIIGMAGIESSGSPPFTPRAKKVLELSLRESLQLGHSYIGTEHLLLGLIREGEGVAVTVLASLGASLGRLQQETVRLIGGQEMGGPLQEVDVGDESLAPGAGWTPPMWDRPSEGTVPAVIAIDAIVLQSDVVVVAIDRLEVYPNGFMINLLMRVDPRKVGDVMQMLRPLGANRWPRVAVRFADGRTVGRGPGIGSMPDLAKDENGVPIEPFMSMGNRGGAPEGWRAWTWVFPLPPEGALEVFVALEAAGLDESSITIDGSAVRAAAERAVVIWT